MGLFDDTTDGYGIALMTSDDYADFNQVLEDTIKHAAISDLLHQEWTTPDEGEQWYPPIFGKDINGIEVNDEDDPNGPLHQKAQAIVTGVYDKWRGKITGLLDEFGMLPDPAGFATDLSDATQAAEQLNIVPGTIGPNSSDTGATGRAGLAKDLTNLSERTAQLKGAIASTFHDDFVAPLPTVLGNYHVATTALAFGQQAEAELWKRARKDTMTLLSKSDEAMSDSRPDDSGGNDLLVALTIVGAVIAVAASFPVSAEAAIALGVAGAATGTLSSLLPGGDDPEQPSNNPLAGDDPDAVFGKMQDAVKEFKKHLVTEETHIQQILDRVDDATYKAGEFDLGEPKLLKSTDAHAIVPELDLDLSEVHKITDLWMPEIVAVLSDARGDLVATSGPWDRPADLGLGSLGPWSSYSELQHRMTGLMLALGTRLQESAQHLATAVAAVGKTDDSVQDRMLRRQTRLAERTEPRLQSAENPTINWFN